MTGCRRRDMDLGGACRSGRFLSRRTWRRLGLFSVRGMPSAGVFKLGLAGADRLDGGVLDIVRRSKSGSPADPGRSRQCQARLSFAAETGRDGAILA